MKNLNLKLLLTILTISLLIYLPVFAQFNVSVFPEIIQERAKPRDVLEYKIKIKNSGNTLYHFYALVEDLGEKENIDKTTSLAKWIEFFRGRTEIFPGQEKEIPLLIKIPSFANPGSYFAQIVFAQGSSEPDAREKAKGMNMPKLLLNIIVEENVIEKLQIKKFQTEKNFYFTPNIKFQIELENIGNKEIEPDAKIIFYGKRGEEIAYLELEKQKILPGENKNYEIFWKANKIGQLKAILFGEYGKNNEKTFQDTVIFWFFPWQYLLLILFLLLVSIFLITWVFSKNLRKRYVEIFRPRKIFDIFKKS